ncbi:MAG: glutamine synthetase [Balneola sp.]|nr:MAG: glutamine synthetase [Balneola sp.]
MTKQQIEQLLENSSHQSVKFAVTDIDGVLRGKLISKEKFLNALDKGVGFCNVIFGWDMNDEVYDNSEVSGWHTGYPDSFALIDPSTIRNIPWEEGKLFFLADFSESNDLSGVCPRSVLKKVEQQLSELGYTSKFSAEFEWFNFLETPHSLQEKDYTNPTPLTPGMFGYSILRASQNSEYVNDLFESLSNFGVPIEGLHTETGDGVYEAAIAYTSVVEAADRATLFKTAVKEIASQYGLTASFMSKWTDRLPGCSAHIHQSLWDAEGNNLFYDDKREKNLTELAQQYIAGVLHCLPYIMPMYAPTINSYKRYVEGSWAPTSASWGVENRTTTLRVIPHGKKSMRIENRVPGADINPYLAMAGSLASGLYGINNNLELNIPATSGNQYELTEQKRLPQDLKTAIEAMKDSEIPVELFGKEFVDHFIKTREWECHQYDPNKSNWELKRYFEII